MGISLTTLGLDLANCIRVSSTRARYVCECTISCSFTAATTERTLQYSLQNSAALWCHWAQKTHPLDLCS